MENSEWAERAERWQNDLAERVGRGVALARKGAGISAAKLAERTIDLGYPIQRGIISKIENNLRGGKVDLAELFVISTCLGVPPALLICPDLDSTRADLAPGIESDELGLVGWLAGLRFPNSAFEIGVNRDAYWFVRYSEELRQLRAELWEVEEALDVPGDDADVKAVRRLMRDRALLRELLAEKGEEVEKYGSRWLAGEKASVMRVTNESDDG